MTTDRARAGADLTAIARGGVLNLAGSVVAGLSGVLLTVVVTNAWDARTAGLLFSSTALFLILTAVCLLGTDTGLAKFVLGLESRRGNGQIDVLLASTGRATVLTALAISGVVVGGARPLADLLGLPDDAAIFLRILGFALPLAVIADASLAATRSYGVMRPTVVLDRLLRSGFQLLCVAAAALAGAGMTGLAGAWALPYLVVAVLAPLALLRLRRRRRATGEVYAPPPGDVRSRGDARSIRRAFWTFTWPRAVARVCQVALQRSDILMVAALRSPTEAAFYTAATRFVVFGQLGTQAVQQVLQPRLASLIAQKQQAAVGQVFRATTAWIMAMAWPVYLTAVVVAPLYLALFGREYVEAGQFTVVVIGLGMLLAVAAGPVDVLLLMSGRSITSLMNNLASLVVNVALNLVLIPRMGFDGAAIAWAVALVVRNGLPFWQVRADSGLSGFGRSAALVAAASIGCFVVPMALLRAATGLSPLTAGPLLLAETVVYAALLRRWRSKLELPALRRPGRAGERAAGAEGGPVEELSER